MGMEVIAPSPDWDNLSMAGELAAFAEEVRAAGGIGGVHGSAFACDASAI